MDQVVEHWRHESPIRPGGPFVTDVRLSVLHDDERCRGVRYVPGGNVDGDLTLESLMLRRFGWRVAARACSAIGAHRRSREDFAFSRVHCETDHAAFRDVGFFAKRRVGCIGRGDPEIAIDVQTHGHEGRRR